MSQNSVWKSEQLLVLRFFDGLHWDIRSEMSVQSVVVLDQTFNLALKDE